MDRDFSNLNKYLDALMDDIYPQPPDEWHTKKTIEVIYEYRNYVSACKNVLDVGCGEAFAQPIFEEYNIDYRGVCLGNDFQNALDQGRHVIGLDFTFMDWFPDEFFDLIFARHSLEHSPMPVLTLMEWHRVARKYLILVMPEPRYWLYGGRNHYGIMPIKQCKFLLDRSGWEILDEYSDEKEYWIVCKKVNL